MKKYLIAGALALICNGLLTSCGEDFENYGSLEEAKKAQFAENFEKFYGTPDPNQDWGFGDASVVTARARTRGANDYGTVIKKDEPGYPTSIAPAPITKAEAEWVTKWFQNNPGLTKQGQPFQNFFVQFVSGDQSNKKGVWHRYDQNRINNGYDSNSWDEEFTDNGGMDKLHVGAVCDQSKTVHLKDFNAKTGGPWDVVYIKNGSALQFGYHSSWGEDNKAPKGDGFYWYFKMVELPVPGSCFDDGQDRKGWYVGLSLCGKKYDNGDKILGEQRLQYAEDWILKVVPGEGNTIVNTENTVIKKKQEVVLHNWVFCEDLANSASRADFDYNDLVFDAKIIKEQKVCIDENNNETIYAEDPTIKYYAEVTPLAAGGELAINFQQLGGYIHQMFKPAQSNNVLINTCKENENYVLSHTEGLLADPVRYELSSETEANIDNITILVRAQNVAYDLRAYKGKAPHKICVPVGTHWAYELKEIIKAYTGFESYVGGGEEPWSNTGNPEFLFPYESLKLPKNITESQIGVITYEDFSSSSTTSYSYTLVSKDEYVLWKSDSYKELTWKNGQSIEINPNDLKDADLGNGSIIRIYGVTDGAFDLKATYLDIDDWADIDLENTDWVNSYNNKVDMCNFHSNTARSYVELRLTPTTAKNFIERGIRIYGNNFKALAVTYDNSRKGADEPDTPASGGSFLWSGSHNLGYSLDFVLLKGTFANATSTSKIRVTATATNQYSQIHMYKKENQWQATQFATIFADNNWPGVVEFTIGNHLGTLQDNDIVLQGGGLTLTKIELIP